MSERPVWSAWAMVLLWLVVQVTLTTLPGSSLPDIGATVYTGGHFLMYAVLGGLVTRALLRAGFGGQALVYAWPTLVAFGALDEWHQRFLPTRSPSTGDLVMDALGAAFGLWLAARTLRTRWADWLR